MTSKLSPFHLITRLRGARQPDAGAAVPPDRQGPDPAPSADTQMPKARRSTEKEPSRKFSGLSKLQALTHKKDAPASKGFKQVVNKAGAKIADYLNHHPHPHLAEAYEPVARALHLPRPMPFKPSPAAGLFLSTDSDRYESLVPASDLPLPQAPAVLHEPGESLLTLNLSAFDGWQPDFASETTARTPVLSPSETTVGAQGDPTLEHGASPMPQADIQRHRVSEAQQDLRQAELELAQKDGPTPALPGDTSDDYTARDIKDLKRQVTPMIKTWRRQLDAVQADPNKPLDGEIEGH